MARIVGHLPVAEPEAGCRRRGAPSSRPPRCWPSRRVEELAARYNAFGPEALGDRRRRNGRAAGLLTEAVLAALAERLTRPPEDGGLWSGPKVAAWMARHLGLAKVHPQRGWEALQRIG